MKSKKIFMKFLALGLSIGNVLSGNVFISSVKAGRCKSTIKRVYAIKYKNQLIRLDCDSQSEKRKRQNPVSNATAPGVPNPFNGNAMNIPPLQNQTAPGVPNPFNGNAMNIPPLQNQTAPGVPNLFNGNAMNIPPLQNQTAPGVPNPFNGNAVNIPPLQNQLVTFFVLVPVVDIPTQQPTVDFDKTA